LTVNILSSCTGQIGSKMIPSRRTVLTGGSAGLLLQSTNAQAQTTSDIAAQIKGLFRRLPGINTLKIWAPATSDTDEILVVLHPSQRVFVASAFKCYVLAACLKALDAPNIVSLLKSNELTLDDSVWSLGSDILNPPDLTGLISERTAAEAMIMHSDNTGTDMIMKATGVGYIRQVIAGLGLTHTQIPDSTRSFGAYLFGLPNYKTASYAEVLAAATSGTPVANPFLNDVETIASSASDLVSLYSHTLQGDFFANAETLNEYRRILSLADGVFEAVPFGTRGFAKTGYSDFPGFHARSNAGAVTFDGKWIYFASIINWDSPEQNDPQTVMDWTEAIRSALQLVYQHLSPDPT
jgi:beta-lactamase class A